MPGSFGNINHSFLMRWRQLQSSLGIRTLSCFPHLRQGFLQAIFRIFRLQIASGRIQWNLQMTFRLSIHLQNWRSATVEPSVTRSLLQEELDQGFCFKFEGSVEDAQRAWPLAVAIGRLSVASREATYALRSGCGTFLPHQGVFTNAGGAFHRH